MAPQRKSLDFWRGPGSPPRFSRMDAARKPKPPPSTMSRVVVTFTDASGAPQVSLARLQTPGAYQRYWVEDHQPLSRLHLGERLKDVECTRATPADEDFGTKTWADMRVARNEPYPTGDHLVVLEPWEDLPPEEPAR
jgi:hypothetical protein